MPDRHGWYLEEAQEAPSGTRGGGFKTAPRGEVAGEMGDEAWAEGEGEGDDASRESIAAIKRRVRQRRYYKKHREEINQRRRERYKEGREDG